MNLNLNALKLEIASAQLSQTDLEALFESERQHAPDVCEVQAALVVDRSGDPPLLHRHGWCLLDASLLHS